jgi:hypothetical protein
VGGYKHVVVSKNSKVVDGDIVEALQQLPRGTADGDCIHKVIQLYKYIFTQWKRIFVFEFWLVENLKLVKLISYGKSLDLLSLKVSLGKFFAFGL